MKPKTMFFVSFQAVFVLAVIGFSVMPAAVFGAGDSGAAEPLAGAEKVAAPSETSTTDEYHEVIRDRGTEGPENTFYGDLAGNGNTGRFGTFIGAEAGTSGNSGDSNTFVGQRSGYKNTTGDSNTFVGRNAGALNTEGDYNTFVGRAAGYENTIGNNNTFFGYYAGSSTKTIGFASGTSNTFIGSHAGHLNTTGDCNTCVGMQAGLSNTTGVSNTFVGRNAGYKNTEGDSNTFVGRSAGYENTEGDYNTFVGRDAGYENTEGDSNTFVGRSAGHRNTEGYCNTFIGEQTGYHNMTGDGNVFIGTGAGYNEESSNKLYIDNSDTATPLIWGDFETNNVVIYGGFRSIASHSSSDARWKKKIKPLKSSLDKISSLQGVSYEWKTDKYPDFGLTEGKQIGLVAQDVEKELPELVSEDKDGYKAVSYTRLTAVLVEAVKELKAENERQKSENKRQQAEIEELRAFIKELKS